MDSTPLMMPPAQEVAKRLGPESVRGNDSRWLGTEWRSSVIHAVLVFEAKEGVNVDHFRRLLLKRVIPLYPRLTQRLISLPILAGIGNCWVTDAKFSIDEHVFSGPPVLTNNKDLQDYVSKLIGDGLPEDKPPWQLQVFQSFGISQDTIVILRVHQSVADGTALMRLLCHSLADAQIIEIPERPRFGSFAFCMNVFRACIVGPLTLLIWFLFSGEDCNLLTHRSTWTGSVTVTWSASITLPKVIRIKQVTRSTVNCVLLSALAGALRRLLQGCGVKQPPDVKVVVPMDLRDQTSTTSIKTKLGNKTSTLIMPLPVAVEGCVPRLWATRKTLDSLRTSADPVIFYVATAALMSIGSASFARHLLNFFTGRASLQFASLPGPTSEILLEGQTLKGIYPVLPAQANLGISITTITYADQVFVSVLAERALGPTAELILEYLEDQIEVLWKLLLNRRVPGEQESPNLYSKTCGLEFSMKEISSKPLSVSKEIELSSENKDGDKNEKMSNLKAEFSELVDELKRRQSYTQENERLTSKTDKVNPLACSKEIFKSPENSVDQSSFTGIIANSEVDKSINKNLQKTQSNSRFNRAQTEQKFEVTSREEDNKKNNKNVECLISTHQKDCVINILENNLNFCPIKIVSNQSNNFDRNYENDPVFNEKPNTYLKHESRINSISTKRTNFLPSWSNKGEKSLKEINGKVKTKEIIQSDFASSSSFQQNDDGNVKQDKIETNDESTRLLGENHSQKKAPEKINLSDKKGPNIFLNCDKNDKKHLKLVTIEEKLFQVSSQNFVFSDKSNKLEETEESEIVGGVLI